MRNDGANRIGRLVVMPGSGDQASKLELLRAACKELEPVSGDHARRRAIRYGIVNSARQVKTSYELHSMKVSGRPVQRSDLRKALESVQVHARGLETLLSRRDVQEALAQASRSKEWIAQTTIYIPSSWAISAMVTLVNPRLKN